MQLPCIRLTMERTTTTTTLTLLIAINIAFAQRAEVVDTSLGPIQGMRKTVLGKEVDVYYGIPFARPPVGELRFKRPEPAEPWSDVMSTVTKPNACFQTVDTAFDKFPGVDMWNPNTPMSEDCLYLNVWVPRGFGSQPPKTTMMWIYGGSFSAGSSALDVYDASKLAATQNVIVASMNYRIGPLGFLYTGTMDAPGNQGLLDQSLALKWIYDNVANFGGQQNSITVFGESAGAISLGLHLMSPLSRDYFTRGIMQSGSPLSSMLLMEQTEATARSQRLSAMFDCPQDSVQKMVRCLREVSAENVTNAQWGLVASGAYLDLPMRPVVDDYFLEDDPGTLVAQGAIKDTELLMGVNKDEGMYFLLYGFPALFPLDNSGHISRAEFKTLVQTLNNKNGEELVDRAVMYEYVDRVIPAHRPSFRDIADDISGDSSFICPTVDFAQALGAVGGGRDVYLYLFDHRLSNNPWPEWTGVMHGYEIEAVFGLPLDHDNYTQQDVQLADRVMGYWTRFAQTGNPNNVSDVIWPKLTSQEAQYLRLTGQGDSVEQGLRHEQCSFRSSILPLLQQDSPKDPPECLINGQRITALPFLPLVVFCSVCLPVFFTITT